MKLPKLTKNKQRFTDAKKELYIKGGGIKCPLCRSVDIEGGFVQTDTSLAWQRMQCNKCEARWRDIYRLIDIEET